INDYLAAGPFEKIDESHPAAKEAAESVRSRIDKLLSIDGERTVDSIHKELGHIMWEYCGMERNEEACARPSTRSASSARSSGPTSRSSAPTTNSTRPWRRPAGWPTSWSWASSCASTPCTAGSP